ncbi:MAG: FtsX-like permease family protein [Chloroflexi bacterium]|nr:FtsX-like permease family protein [Chloroflexota bacterium]
MESFKAALIPLMIILGLAGIVLAAMAMRERVFFVMGVRNLTRRPAQMVLTFIGLMLAAMIFSASFSIGDTLTNSIRGLGADIIGEVDLRVESKSTESLAALGYFDESLLQQVSQALQDEPRVEAIAPAIGEIVPTLAPKSNLYEPVVTLMGVDDRYTEGFDPLRDAHGRNLSIADLGENEVYVSAQLAEKIDLSVGDEVQIFLSGSAKPMTVTGIFDRVRNPVGTEALSLTKIKFTVVMPLDRLQALAGREGEINAILISNQGGVIGGAKYSDEVKQRLEADAGLEGAGLKVFAIKKDNLDAANEAGAAFTTLFLVLGSFSLMAGVLLVFLVFVMLAAERKKELGIARAVGAQQGHVTHLFTFEGVPYAFLSSAIGSLLGLLLGWAMVQLVAPSFEQQGFPLVYKFTPSGVAISYALGVIVTLAVVFFSARRVSRLNIVSAIRDTPEPERGGGGGIRRWAFTVLLPLLGLMILFSGLQQKQFATYSLGSSLAIIGVPLLGRRLGLPDRAAFTAIGVALLGFWLTPARYHPLGEESSTGMEMFILAGVMLVAGAVWLVMYNSDVLLAIITGLFGRLRRLAPILKTAVAYPLAARFRTGMAVAMFSMVIFTLVMMSSMNASFSHLLSDTYRVSGGFHIIASASPANPISDIKTAMEERGIDPDNFEAIAASTVIPIEMRQAGTEGEWEEMTLTGVDASFIDSNSFEFDLMTRDYASATEVWDAVKNVPSVAVVNAVMVPGGEGMFGPTPDLSLKGDFNLKSDYLPDNIAIEVRSPLTGEIYELKVIAVVDQMAFYAPFVAMSKDTLDAFAGWLLPPTYYWFKLKSDKVADAPQLAKSLESGFRDHGIDTIVVEEEVKDITRMTQLFLNLMMAFMGLGLIVGIAALGVIAARTVVERRQQIGVLRAIGFRQGMVQFSFLLESSFVALLGIIIGVVLGVVLTYQVVPEAGVQGLTTVIPWARIALIAGVAYLASLTTTFLPARQAARVYPAEALRYY